MKAIVIATKTGRCLPVLLESINQYVPDDVTIYLSGYDHILISPNPKVYASLCKDSFIKQGRPKQPFEIAISTALLNLHVCKSTDNIVL
jgi:hypothetical protein